VFPEYVNIIPQYQLNDKNFTIKDFHQVDKTSLILDTIAALQAQARRFSMSQKSPEKGGDIKISSSSWLETAENQKKFSSGDVNVVSGDTLQDKSGMVEIRTGSSEGSIAGSIVLSPGASGGGDGATVFISGGESQAAGFRGGNVDLVSGAGTTGSGDIAIATQLGSGSTGSIHVLTGTSSSGSAGSISVLAGATDSLKGASVVLSAGLSTSSSGEGGDLSLAAGSGGSGGGVSVVAGSGNKGFGGSVRLSAGPSTGPANGGSLVFNGGSASGE
jgi:hypothetical protein